ncbi:hypothetical protein O181_028755 [Austropuccinia psidii MF-1]|uniref:Uncharacterized protein n=1 Tax=Austropuccinia psidii MF-1 TaxID=1389203 RepID=A0A9Q3H4I6_9BASI|nr:hypothetical protein [Austropuccinia psidii MF-1]
MSSKLTELTESSPSAPPPSVLHGSGILITRQLKFLILLVLNFLKRESIVLKIANPDLQNATTASLGRSHAAALGSKLQTSGGTCGVRRMGLFGKEFPVSEALTLDGTSGYSALTGSRQRDVARWTNVGGPIPVGGRPIYSSSEVPISGINTEGIVKRIRRIANSPPDPDAEGSDELDGKEVEVFPNSAGHQSNNSPSQPPSKIFKSQVIPSTPRTFQPTLATIPPVSPNSSHTRPALNPEVRPSPIQQPRNPPIVTSQQLQPVASTRGRREERSSLLFPAAQVFQNRDQWPI